jgi:hypothetical protein
VAVYFFQVSDFVVKIGYSVDLCGVEGRLSQARCWCPWVRVLCVLPDATREDERAYHERFEAFRVAREMFKLTEELSALCAGLAGDRDWHVELMPSRVVEPRSRADRELDARMKQERAAKKAAQERASEEAKERAGMKGVSEAHVRRLSAYGFWRGYAARTLRAERRIASAMVRKKVIVSP